MSVCSACPVDVGECPDCGMFWWRRNGKRRGMRPTTAEAAATARKAWATMADPTGTFPCLEALPNVVLAPGESRATPRGWKR